MIVTVMRTVILKMMMKIMMKMTHTIVPVSGKEELATRPKCFRCPIPQFRFFSNHLILDTYTSYI